MDHALDSTMQEALVFSLSTISKKISLTYVSFISRTIVARKVAEVNPDPIDHVLTEYVRFVKPAFDDFIQPVSDHYF